MNSDSDTMDTAHSDKFDKDVDTRENVLNNIDSYHQLFNRNSNWLIYFVIRPSMVSIN